MADLNPGANNKTFWTFHQSDAEKRADELKKYSSTASGALAKISPQLIAVLPFLAEAPSEPLPKPSSSPDSLDFARKASWFFNGANVSVPDTPRDATQTALARQTLDRLIEREPSPTLAPKKDFSNSDELRELLKADGHHSGVDPAVGARQPTSEPMREGAFFYSSATPADPRKPAADRVLAMLKELAEKHPEQWAMCMSDMMNNEDATPEQYVEQCKVNIKAAILGDLIDAEA
jgi:hypothetical protein